MHCDDGRRHSQPVSVPAIQLRLDQRRVEIPASRFAVHQGHPGAAVARRVGRRNEGEIGHQHVVTRADAHSQHRQVEGGGPACARHRVLSTDPLGELPFETGNEGAH